MNAFQYHTPETLDEALSLLDRHGESATLIAGGTALVLFMKQRLVQPEHLVSLQRVPDLAGVSRSNGGIRAGAMATHRAVETSPLVASTIPLLVDTYRHVATPRIRNVATVGGGLVHADPNLDPPPGLIALGAVVTLVSSSGERAIPVEDLFLDYYETSLNPGEIVTRVDVPEPQPNTGGAFIKFLPRTADDYATVLASTTMTLSEDGTTCLEVRIGLGSVGITPIRATRAEEVLRGQAPSPELIRRAAEAVEAQVDPMDDFRGSAAYKTRMAVVFTRRVLEQALANARGERAKEEHP